MTELVALNSKTHRALRVAVERARRACVVGNVLGVVPREFARLVAHYPIFFAKNTEDGQFEPAVLLGFSNTENLMAADGVWHAAYMPLQIQRQPFALIPRRDSPTSAPNSTANGASNGVANAAAETLDLALDVGSPCVQTQEGERLFDDDGAATPFLQNIGAVMKALVSGTREAHAFTAKLTQYNLLEPVRIDIKFIDGSDTKLEGLYWIAPTALKALPAQALAELRDAEQLEWLYFQMASLAHVPGLVARRNRMLAAR